VQSKRVPENIEVVRFKPNTLKLNARLKFYNTPLVHNMQQARALTHSEILHFTKQIKQYLEA
jgi:hypothetical protein